MNALCDMSAYYVVLAACMSHKLSQILRRKYPVEGLLQQLVVQFSTGNIHVNVHRYRQHGGSIDLKTKQTRIWKTLIGVQQPQGVYQFSRLFSGRLFQTVHRPIQHNHRPDIRVHNLGAVDDKSRYQALPG